MLRIMPQVLNKMILDVENYSEERCGFFFGYERPKYRLITKSMTAVNSKRGDKSSNFEISSDEYLLSEGFAVSENLNLLGVYHSHINYPAIPSGFDWEAAQPYFSYVIISIRDMKFEEVRSWHLDDSLQFVEERIKLLKSI